MIGESKEQPVWMKLVRDEEGIKWGNIVIMLALTAVSGYLATVSQRAGSQIDFSKVVKMKACLAGERLGSKLTRLGVELSLKCSRAYDKVVM